MAKNGIKKSLALAGAGGVAALGLTLGGAGSAQAAEGPAKGNETTVTASDGDVVLARGGGTSGGSRSSGSSSSSKSSSSSGGSSSSIKTGGKTVDYNKGAFKTTTGKSPYDNLAKTKAKQMESASKYFKKHKTHHFDFDNPLTFPVLYLMMADSAHDSHVDHIDDLQDILGQLGYYKGGDQEGEFGTNTDSALRAFQKDAGIPVTGQTDDPTKLALAQAAHPEGDIPWGWILIGGSIALVALGATGSAAAREGLI